MKITFLYHSCFLVELEHCVLLFDWCGGALPPLPPGKPLYVFASHHHPDHYAPQIFSLGMDRVWYVLATCIRLSAKQKARLGIAEPHVVRMAADKRLQMGPLEITTLKSTDAGVAFLIRGEGKTIYHAGDLNWWHWEGEADPWNPDMERNFKKTCEKLKGLDLDAAFLVLDPRQKDAFWWGFDWYMRTFRAKAAFPMHSWKEFGMAPKIKALPCSEPYRNRIMEISYEGQSFVL